MANMHFLSEEKVYMELISRLFEDVFNKGRLDEADNILSPDFVLHYPFPWLAPNIDGLKNFVKIFHTAFPNLDLTIEDLYAKENKVTIRWTARGKHEGDLLGISPTGRQVTVTAIGMYTGGGGNDDFSPVIVEGWISIDALGMLQQIGIVRQYIDLLPSLRK
jgi:predicted ester cyclase